MKNLCVFALFLLSFPALAQLTPNPKVTRKSQQNVFINKIEITDQYTVVSMQFVSKSAKESLEEYLDKDSGKKEKNSGMDALMRELLMQQWIKEFSNQQLTISFNAGAYLKSADGQQFKFIKATNIPISPESKQVEIGKKYFFKTYFEKLKAGIQKIDLIENEAEETDGYTYWNFYGVEVNNPLNAKRTSEAPDEPTFAEEFVINGTVFELNTEKPLAAKIICKKANTVVDSTQTSRTGRYEFLVNHENYVYQVSAPGYRDYEQTLDLRKWKMGEITQDFYLEPDSQQAVTEGIEKVDDKTYRLNNVYFPSAKADILEESYPELDKVVAMLTENPEIRVRVDGHTDNIGDSELNKLLSIDRAKNVRDYLIGKGAATDRIEFKGWGDTKPIYPNANDQQRQKNRRVEIVILD